MCIVYFCVLGSALVAGVCGIESRPLVRVLGGRDETRYDHVASCTNWRVKTSVVVKID